MKAIRQKVNFKATPHEVYEALMDQRKHSEFTQSNAKISRKAGGSFSVYDGYSTGKNLMLIQDKKIIQTWRASDWPENHFSTVMFEFEETKTGTKLIFTQKNVPPDQYAAISTGWKEHYWDKMKKMFEKK